MRRIALACLGVLSAAAIRCSNAAAEAPSAGGGPAAATGSDGAAPGVETPGDQEPELPPEVELEDDFRVPVSTGRFVWTANPESNRVALIDSKTFGVVALDAGFAPTFLAALPTPAEARSGAIVINALSTDATVFLAKDISDVVVSRPVPIHAGANAWEISESGRWAIAWSDASRLSGIDATEGLQDVSVIDLEGYPEKQPSVTRLSVGYRPTKIFITAAEDRAFAVAEPGISVIELAGSGAPLVSRDIEVSQAPAAEVAITPNGKLALVRQSDSEELLVVDLETTKRKVVMLPGVVTDLDLDQTGSFAVAIVRSVVEARATEELGSAGQEGEGGSAGAEGEPVGASGGAGDTGQQPQWTSVVAILPVPEIYADVTEFSMLSVPELVGSVVVPATGNHVLLFTNAVDSDRVTIMDTSTETWRVVELKAPVRALFASPDGEHAVGLLAPPQASSKAGAFSLVPVARNLPPKLQGTKAATLGVVVSDNSAIITTRDSTNGIYEAFLASLPGLRVDAVELPSAPTASGIIVDSNIGFIAQQHAEGRITFVGLEDVSVRTLTGFELGLKVIDGE